MYYISISGGQGRAYRRGCHVYGRLDHGLAIACIFCVISSDHPLRFFGDDRCDGIFRGDFVHACFREGLIFPYSRLPAGSPDNIQAQGEYTKTFEGHGKQAVF